MTVSETCASHYHAQLVLSDKGSAIKGLVNCSSWGIIEPLDLQNGLQPKVVINRTLR